MKCEQCHTAPARVHVTELHDLPPQVLGPGTDGRPQLPVYSFEEQHLCEECASKVGVPFAQIKKTHVEIWKLLHATAQRQKRESNVSCPDCGMTLAEFREKGRLGCPRDYEIFREHLDRLLERVHSADHHVGRLPGRELPARIAAPEEGSDTERVPAELPEADPGARRDELNAELERAVREEDYERAAELRDLLRELER